MESLERTLQEAREEALAVRSSDHLSRVLASLIDEADAPQHGRSSLNIVHTAFTTSFASYRRKASSIAMALPVAAVSAARFEAASAYKEDDISGFGGLGLGEVLASGRRERRSLPAPEPDRYSRISVRDMNPRERSSESDGFGGISFQDVLASSKKKRHLPYLDFLSSNSACIQPYITQI